MTCFAAKHLKFEGRNGKMMVRMDIEDLFKEIDLDLSKYASAFRKSGFTSSVINQ